MLCVVLQLRQYVDDSNFPEWTRGQRGITESLLLPEKPPSGRLALNQEISCLLCPDLFCLPEKAKDLFSHLLKVHNFVIGETQSIALLAEYINYWRNKFQHRPMTEYCTLINAKVQEEPNSQLVQRQFYFLSDILQEDKELRIHLQMKKLELVLEEQEKERRDPDFRRTCLFCRTVFQGAGQQTRLLDHMAFDHNFSVGQPDNLVFIGELMDLLEGKLDNLACIYCEKTFKSRDILKEHMRKKSHKKINPNNEAYDRFYLVNYLELGKSWQDKCKQRHSELDNEDELPTGFNSDEEGQNDNDWSDWKGELSGAVCLFCNATYTDLADLMDHMSIVHLFDYAALKSQLQLDFYRQVKLVNYIRRCLHLNTCIFCSVKMSTREALLQHLHSEKHMKPPEDSDEWDQPQYFFPTYENDSLLYLLEDNEAEAELNDAAGNNLVIPEDPPLV